MNTHLLEAHPSPDRSPQSLVATHPTLARLTGPRSSAADRLALRLGVALVIWGRRHVDRGDSRSQVVALGAALQARGDRELAAQRLLLVTVPRR
jgi:hypothetical protein